MSFSYLTHLFVYVSLGVLDPVIFDPKKTGGFNQHQPTHVGNLTIKPTTYLSLAFSPRKMVGKMGNKPGEIEPWWTPQFWVCPTKSPRI
jgi:hypothetical protein